MASIADIRKKFPQYDDMSDQELADAVHAKFYSDMPKTEFDQKIGLQPRSAPAQQDFGDVLSAGFTSGVKALPIVGPSVMGGLNNVKAFVQSHLPGNAPVTAAEIEKENQQLEQANPIASTTGEITGTVAPFLVGGAIPGVARVLGMEGGLASRILFGAGSGGVINAGDTAARGGTPEEISQSALIGAGLGTALPAAEKLIGTTYRAVTKTGASKAAKNVGRALNDDDIPVNEINQRLAQMGPEATLMDLGPNLQRQAGAVASVPGKGQKMIRDAVEGRKANAPARVQGDVATALGQGPEASALREQIIAQQSAAAKPLYDKVRDIQVPMLSGDFAAVFQTPMGRQALTTARQMAANDGYRGVDTIGIVDYAKRALDDISTSAARKGDRNLARQANDLARRLTTAADRVAPDYRAARQAFAGPAQILDAMDAGESVFSKEMTPRQLEQALNTMTASERDAFIQAARSSVESQMGNAVNEALTLRNMFKKGYNEAKLRMIVGDDVADQLLAGIDREAKYGQTANVVAGNSETAARQAAQHEVAPELRRTERPQGAVGALFYAFDKARTALNGTRQPKINAEMAGLHTQRQLTPEQLKMLQRAVRPLPNSIVGPATGGLLTGPNKPLEITVHGGAR